MINVKRDEQNQKFNDFSFFIFNWKKCPKNAHTVMIYNKYFQKNPCDDGEKTVESSPYDIILWL